MDKKICIKCKSTNIKEFVEMTDIEYKDTVIEFPINYSVCQSCGREFVSTPQIKKGDKFLREAKQKIDNNS